MIKMIRYEETDSFKGDLKKLKKRFSTIYEDLETVKKNAIELFHALSIDNQSIVSVQGGNNEEYKVYKIRKFACKALKGRGVQSGVRVIYAYCLETAHITFLEIYFKADQECEDRDKIVNFLNEKSFV